MKIGDKILIVIVLSIAAMFALYLILDRNIISDKGQSSTGKVTVTVDNEVYGVYLLDEDQTVTVHTEYGMNIFEIKNNEVSMIEADCPDKICKEYQPIHHIHDTIVCLPHKLVLEITEGSERESDALDG